MPAETTLKAIDEMLGGVCDLPRPDPSHEPFVVVGKGAASIWTEFRSKPGHGLGALEVYCNQDAPKSLRCRVLLPRGRAQRDACSKAHLRPSNEETEADGRDEQKCSASKANGRRFTNKVAGNHQTQADATADCNAVLNHGKSDDVRGQRRGF